MKYSKSYANDSKNNDYGHTSDNNNNYLLPILQFQTNQSTIIQENQSQCIINQRKRHADDHSVVGEPRAKILC